MKLAGGEAYDESKLVEELLVVANHAPADWKVVHSDIISARALSFNLFALKVAPLSSLIHCNSRLYASLLLRCQLLRSSRKCCALLPREASLYS